MPEARQLLALPAMTSSSTAPTTPPWYVAQAHWIGAAVGIGIAVFDTAAMGWLGIAFAMNGRDVGWLVGTVFGSSLAVMGYLIGRLIEVRRRERDQSAVIRTQMEAIEAARARLVQSEKLAALGQLSASIAHEVRNPLAVIRSAAQSLDESVAAGDDEGRRACQFIIAEIDRLTSVVSSLLAFARPLRLDPRPVAVDELFDSALLLAAPDLTRQHVRVARPDGPLPLRVRADVDLVRQVLVGLLVNAVEAVGPDGEVRLAARPRGDAVEIEVADSGPGVPAELQTRIFEPFFTTRARGTGLGLPIARQIVEAHGGKLEVGEPRGRGARFLVHLPAAPAALAA
jgi:two-component system sensor histidine kinase HydH